MLFLSCCHLRATSRVRISQFKSKVFYKEWSWYFQSGKGDLLVWIRFNHRFTCGNSVCNTISPMVFLVSRARLLTWSVRRLDSGLLASCSPKPHNFNLDSNLNIQRNKIFGLKGAKRLAEFCRTSTGCGLHAQVPDYLGRSPSHKLKINTLVPQHWRWSQRCKRHCICFSLRNLGKRNGWMVSTTRRNTVIYKKLTLLTFDSAEPDFFCLHWHDWDAWCEVYLVWYQ